MSDIVLSCQQLGKRFRQGGQELVVLDRLDLTIRTGEKVAIIGVSGSGKTTLLNLLGGLDTPTTGEVFVKDQPLASLGSNQLDKLRNESLGFVYQFHHLLGEFTAQENVAMPLIIARRPYAECLQRAADMLQQVGLGERLQHKPGQLSGGERQRVAIARALVKKPQVVLADEPTGQLDTRTGEDVFRILRELQRELGTTLVVVTHDRRFIQPQDLVLEIEDGLLKK